MFQRSDDDQVAWFKENGVASLSEALWCTMDSHLCKDPVITPPIVQNMGADLVSVDAECCCFMHIVCCFSTYALFPAQLLKIYVGSL